MEQARMVAYKSRKAAAYLFGMLLSAFLFFAFDTGHAFANTYGDSTYGSNRYSGNNSTTTEPTAPLAVTATAGDRQATVTFSPPSSNGGAAISSYTVTSSPGDITASGTNSPIVVTGLENGTTYTFVMTATNSVGTSATSSPSNAVTPTEPPRSGTPASRKQVASAPPNTLPAPAPVPTVPSATETNGPVPTIPSPVTAPTSPTTSPTNASSPRLARDMQTGSTGSEVKILQKFLNAQGFTVAPAGPGSPGSETELFGAATRAALIKFQIENSISPAVGYFGPKTRELVNSLLAGTQSTEAVPGSETPAVPGTQAPATGQSAFTQDLQTGSVGLDVKRLQEFLNSKGFTVAESGPGSPGSETERFGQATREALIRFQKANGIVPAAGYFGPRTREAIGRITNQ